MFYAGENKLVVIHFMILLFSQVKARHQGPRHFTWEQESSREGLDTAPIPIERLQDNEKTKLLPQASAGFETEVSIMQVLMLFCLKCGLGCGAHCFITRWIWVSHSLFCYLHSTWQCVTYSPALVSPVLTHHEEFALVDSDPINYFWNDTGQALHWGKNYFSGFLHHCFSPGLLQ